MSKKIRVRFAPSPTGHLHIGSVRAALFNWLFARHHKGLFLVRIEDTDLLRSKKEYVDSILDSLHWLDLEPDEPIVYQHARLGRHKEVIERLLQKGLVYPCFCEPKEIEEKLQLHEQGVASRYPGTCRNKPYTQKDLERPHAIRFKVPDDIQAISFDDVIRGMITFELAQLDDFVIWRRDGMPTYNFCVVVDDIDMGITHIIRGEDHISNTPKQILLYQVLEAELPQFAHLPLILGPGGNKLSKRDAAVSVVEYKQEGFLADALFNYLVRLGWSHGDQEVFSKQEMIGHFSLESVGKKGSVFDIKKLLWLNGLYIRNLKYEDFAKHAAECTIDKWKTLTTLWNKVTLVSLFELYKERATTLVELINAMIEFAQTPKTLDISLIKKWMTAQTIDVLKTFIKRAEQMEEYTHDALLNVAKQVCEKHTVKLVALAQPLRLALTGTICSPGIFELMVLLTPEERKKRITRLTDQLQNQ